MNVAALCLHQQPECTFSTTRLSSNVLELYEKWNLETLICLQLPSFFDGVKCHNEAV